MAVPAAATLALSGCGFAGSSPASSSTKTDQRIVIDNNFTPKSSFALETDDALILSQAGCLETLARYDTTTGALKPMLATSWKQTTPTEWDFTLRAGVKFQDGTALDATVVADDLNHVLKATTPPRAFTPKVISSVQALDSSTVRVSTPKPSSLLPYRLASANTGILSPKAYSGETINPTKACTGPFTPVNYVAKQSLTLDRNGAYWGGKAALAGAEMRFLPDGQTRVTQAQTGEAQIALTIPSSSLATLKSNADVKVSSVELPRTTSLYLNTKKAPFTNVKVRQAIQAAIDTKAIASGIYNGAASAAVGPFAATEAWAPKGAQTVTANLDRAKSLFTEAGVDPASVKVQLLAYTERPELADLAAVVQDDLKKLGVQASIKVTNYAAIEPDLLAGNFDMLLLSRSHLTDIADPVGFLASDYSCTGTFNLSHFCDQSVDAQITQAAGTADDKTRYGLYAQVAAQLQEQAVDVFLVNERGLDATRAGVKNYVQDPLARYALTADLNLS
jgi:peptide/nickel transport system substrate-binding protein